MSTKPWNLIFRFFLETAGLVALALWGYSLATGPLRYLLMIAFPVAAAFLWGTFAVPDDPTRRPGRVPVPTPGALRLALEALYFALAVAGLFASGYPVPAVILAALVLIHYVLSWDRIAWLISKRPLAGRLPVKRSSGRG